MSTPPIVSREEWLSARRALLIQEKELTRQRDRVSAQRRALPWVKVDKEYFFETEHGPRTLAQLFGRRSQLIVYHFMWRREYGTGCVGCSFLADHIDGANRHLQHHDVSFVVVSRAPLHDLQAFRERMGWKFDWVSSQRSDFNFDFHVSFTPQQLASGRVFYNFAEMDAPPMEELSGISAFYRDAKGDIFHTYSSGARGNEEVVGTYMWLDLAPLGRNETGPARNLTDWVRHHDKYEEGGYVDPTGAYHPPATAAASCCHGK